MRKTSFGLGLAGTIIAFVIGVIVIIVGLVAAAASHLDWDKITEEMEDVEITIEGEDYDFEMTGDYDIAPGGIVGAIGAFIIVGGVGLVVSGILGIIGSVITKKRKSTAAGVLLLIAAVLSIVASIMSIASIIGMWGLNATAFFIPAGVLAFIKDKNKPVAPAAQEEVVQ